MEKQYVEFIQDVLISIHENIKELSERKGFADPEALAHIDGKIIAYHEVLEILRMGAAQFDLPAHELGLP